MKIITLLSLLITLSSCSFSESGKEEVTSNHDDLEFAVDTLADQSVDSSEFTVAEQKIEEVLVPDEYPASEAQDTAMVAPTEPSFEEFAKGPEIVETNMAVAQDDKISITEAPAQITTDYVDTESSYGQAEMYRVQKGDTLMMIAFKIYGDYRKWKDIKEWNKHVGKIGEGVDLKYYVPDQKFGWAPQGLPYLVKTGDTLQIVSLDKYGTTRRWKSIFDNNRPLIRNPNLIFAGFTIYYKPDRDLASESK